MNTRLTLASLTLLMTWHGLAQADSLVNVEPIPELMELEKQAQAQEEKVKAFSQELAQKKEEATQPDVVDDASKPEPRVQKVETKVTATANKGGEVVASDKPETKTFTTAAGSTTIINNATGPQSVVVNINPSGQADAPKKPAQPAVKKPVVKKPAPEEPVDMWTAQERQYAYP